MPKVYQPTIRASRTPLNPFDFSWAATEARKAKKSRIIAVCNSDPTLKGINILNASREYPESAISPGSPKNSQTHHRIGGEGGRVPLSALAKSS